MVGAFCFAVYLHPFADVAFVIGTAMIVAGILLTVSYIIAGRGETKLNDAALVEGLATFFYGFSVINAQVGESTLTLFFGTWLTLSGFTRISQSFYVSRINPKDWAKVMPLALVASTIGVIMMMPSTLKSVYPLLLVGGVFILNGFSIIIYSMYMKRTDAEVGAIEQSARERAEAKKALAKAKRQQRDALRNMSKEERYAAQAQIRSERKEKEEQKKREKDAAKQARKEAAASSAKSTISLTKEEIGVIVSNAPPEQLEADELSAEQLKAASKTSFKLPSLPHIHFNRDKNAKKSSTDTEGDLVLSAINIKEIEETQPVIEQEPIVVEYPEPVSGKEDAVDREDVISTLEEIDIPKAEVIDYTPLSFDDEPIVHTAKSNGKSNDSLFNQKLSFEWKEPDISEED